MTALDLNRLPRGHKKINLVIGKECLGLMEDKHIREMFKKFKNYGIRHLLFKEKTIET